jgi:hypothetical protein
MSIPNLVKHRFVILWQAIVEQIGFERTSVWRDLALAKVVTLKESEQQWRFTVDTVEV